jgi:RNA polymerase sigma factor (sigma-70 family)
MMGTVSEHTDETLLGLAATSGAAFGVFYDRHHLAVLVGVRRRVSDAEVALDLTAEIFAVALQRCESFRSQGEGSAKAWLYAIVRNKLIDLYRTGAAEDRARRALRMQPVIVTDEQLEQLEERLTAASAGALEALADLPVDERDAVAARVVDESAYALIARRFDVSESVIRKRVSRGLRRMRATLEETR